MGRSASGGALSGVGETLPSDSAASSSGVTAVLLMAMLVAVSSVSLWFALSPGPKEPTDAEWSAVTAHIGSRIEPGDALRVHPFWLREGGAISDAIQASLGANAERALPVDFSVPLDPLELGAFRRLWLVSAFGRDDAEAPPGATLEDTTAFPGGLTAQLYALPESPVRLRLIDALTSAQVQRFGPNVAKRDCRWMGDRHACRGRPWEDVAVAVHEVGGAPRTCFVLHPYPSGGTVVVRFPAVTLDAGVIIRAGFTLDATKSDQGSDATVRVKLDGAVVLDRVAPRNLWAFVPSFIDTASRRGQKADLAIEVTAVREDFRDLCVDGFVVSRPVPEAMR
ncbi:MAG: hypothetical protein IV100_01865 [Myxococcales bacterium]|nr:hypothetical protein [Myxococcales bacterium]